MLPRFEFHISRRARDRYQFEDALFSLTGNVVFANLHATRTFAQKMNQKRDLVRFPEQAVKAGQLNAMGLIDEILHHAVAQYRQQRNSAAMRGALEWLEQKLGAAAVDRMLRTFADEFPTVALYRQRGNVDAEAYLRGETGDIPNREIVLEEMMMLWLSNANPAFAPFLELFDDSRLEQSTAYPQLARELHAYFDTQPRFGPDNQNLIDMLRAPALASPHSLEGQLEFISSRWSGVLGRYLYRLLTSLDLIKEENKPSFFGPGPAELPLLDFAALAGLAGGADVEQYSPDREWMPRLVLIAKNAFVWLDQLAKKYQRAINTLDQIPDEELDQLARWGFTGLWLIGLWERSPASQRIKQLTGNPDALPSAYSLYDYRIAHDLGGEPACNNLRERAARRGIRLASDMVPNHMGIDSPWVVDHPDWFIALDYSPFPSYNFNGPDLSRDGRVGLYLEDHYYDRSDAAVVFKRVDRQNGGDTFVYHGNDGTSMPWNDTAQLDYLNPAVREAVIQAILHVARQFPIIRFDAAMTLAKRHYQRLWYPEPGTGGAIPSRAGLGLTKEQFDQAMPVEFWREVVDRAAVEAPDTLLLAEAFWMMEGYFVRTLGMHRVYNSAFMNMLRDEDNAKYRTLIKTTLEFDPQILKRYVNFMNNPDERTAVDQFGKGDKYFGICLLMATLPGLPMFGHGQVEGFAEKYGMEFRRAQWDERVDPGLVERHEREIAPLLHRRHLFAGVENFLLYDFYTPEGSVNEEVFAYSNRHGSERALVIYHNKFAQTRGWVRNSAAFVVKGNDGERSLAQRNLGEGLGLRTDADTYAIFRDHVSGLEYIRSNQELDEKGLYVELDAYKRHVFMDFREVVDDAARRYGLLAEYLNGRGVPSVDEAMRELMLQPIVQPFRALVNAGSLRWLSEAQTAANSDVPAQPVDRAMLEDITARMTDLLRAIKSFTGGSGDAIAIASDTRRELESLLRLPGHALDQAADNADATPSTELDEALAYLKTGLPIGSIGLAAGLCWLFVHALGKVVDPVNYAGISRAWIDEWQLGPIMLQGLRELGAGSATDDSTAAQALTLIKALTTQQDWFTALAPEPALATAAQPAASATTVEATPAPATVTRFATPRLNPITGLLADGDVQRYLRINRYRDILWFNKEGLGQWLWWLQVIALLAARADESNVEAVLAGSYRLIRAVLNAEEQSEYQVEKLIAAANK